MPGLIPMCTLLLQCSSCAINRDVQLRWFITRVIPFINMALKRIASAMCNSLFKNDKAVPSGCWTLTCSIINAEIWRHPTIGNVWWTECLWWVWLRVRFVVCGAVQYLGAKYIFCPRLKCLWYSADICLISTKIPNTVSIWKLSVNIYLNNFYTITFYTRCFSSSSVFEFTMNHQSDLQIPYHKI